MFVNQTDTNDDLILEISLILGNHGKHIFSSRVCRTNLMKSECYIFLLNVLIDFLNNLLLEKIEDVFACEKKKKTLN